MVERTARVSAPAVLALFVVVGGASNGRPLSAILVLGVITLAVGVVSVRRRLSGWALIATLGVAVATLATASDGDPSSLGWFGICAVAGWVALAAAPTQALIACAGLAAVFVVEWTLLSDDSGWGAWIAGTVFTTVACAFARRQRVLVEQLELAQAGLAERARTEERNRVAGEVHDVIGHALTVSLLHVSSARLALDDAPDEARASLLEAERLARSSLDEVRAAVGLLRAGQGGTVSPLPSGADVRELVTSFRRAGADVDLDVRGDLHALGANRGLAVYRIVQESLTNATRHGDGSVVSVCVDVAEGATTVRVASTGGSGGPAVDGSGLIGMRERAEALGGRLLAGPAPGGWLVEAVLPT
jgi:signal transduction histidine kinase